MTKSTLERCTNDSAGCAPDVERGATGTVARPTVAPRADAWESPDAAHLSIELPGVREDGLELRVENDHLILRATPADEAPEGRALRAEWRTAAFQRTFMLTDDADRDAIEAKLQQGLLTISIPRRAEKRPRSIPVRVTAD